MIIFPYLQNYVYTKPDATTIGDETTQYLLRISSY